MVYLSGGKIVFFIYGSQNTKELMSSAELRGDEEWYHLLGTYDGSEIKLFINGGPDSSVSFSEDIRVSSSSLFLGWRGVSIDGFLDEFRIYGQSLTAAQARQLYAEALTEKGLAKD